MRWNADSGPGKQAQTGGTAECLQVWDDSQWLQNFRMCKGTFMELCDLLSPALKRMNTKMRAALTVEKQVAIALWKLATPDSYWSVGNQFGVGKSTVRAAV
ncbi:unnamed protein product, partial [Eretmochelys imbricata]